MLQIDSLLNGISEEKKEKYANAMRRIAVVNMATSIGGVNISSVLRRLYQYTSNLPGLTHDEEETLAQNMFNMEVQIDGDQKFTTMNLSEFEQNYKNFLTQPS